MRKGMEFTIRTVAMIVLGIMVVVFLYVTFESWFTTMIDSFTDNLVFTPSD